MSNRSTLSGIFINDWPRKVSAIVLAILIYSIVRMQLQQVQTFNDVRVEIKPDNPKMQVLDKDPIYVDVTLEGTKRAINQLKSNQDIKVIHKIDALTEPGPYTCILGENDIILPQGVTLSGTSSFSPPRLELEVDRVIEKRVDVRILINRDTVPEGWGIKYRKSQPPKVKISGPKSYLDQLHHVETEDMEIVKRIDAPKRIVQSVKLVKPVGVVSIEPAFVEASIELNKNKDFTRFNNISVQVLNYSESNLIVTKFIDPPFVSVSVKGDRNEIDFLEDSHIKAFIELDKDIGVGETLRPIRVWLDRQNRESCTIAGQNPESLRIVIGKKPEKKTPPEE